MSDTMTMAEARARFGCAKTTIQRMAARGELLRVAHNAYVLPGAGNVAASGNDADANANAVPSGDPGAFLDVHEGFFHEEQDAYVFAHMPGTNKPVALPAATVHGIVSDYTAGKATVNEVCARYGMSRARVQHILRTQGITHDSPPFTDRQIAEAAKREAVGELAEDWLALHKSRLVETHQRKKWQQTVEDAERWRLFEHHGLAALAAVVPPAPAAPKRKHFTGNECVWITPTDAHIGMTGDPAAEGRLYAQAACVLLQEMADSRNEPVQAFLGMGSDWLHFDTPGKTTTRGTQMQSPVEYGPALEAACEAAVLYVETVRKYTPSVGVVWMGGNHDQASSFAVMLYLRAFYREASDVTITLHRGGSGREYVRWGRNLFGVTHGHAGKCSDLPRYMAEEAADAWGACPHRAFFHGHYHHSRTQDDMGVRVIQLPALCAGSAWERQNGYIGSHRGVEAWRFHHDLGYVGSLFQRIEESP